MRSIRVYLFALVATCLLLAAAAFGIVVSKSNEINRQHAEAQTLETAKALSQAVDRELERAIGIVAALSTSDAAQAGDWSAVDRQARAALHDDNAWIIVQDRTGRQLLNTALPLGAKLPSAPPPADMWREIAAGRPHVCNLVQGVVEPRIVCVDLPIGRRGTADHAISMVFRPKAFESIVTRQNVGAGNIATLVDRSGMVIWRNIKPEQFVGREATGKILQHVRAGAPAGVLESTSLEGVQMLSSFNRSALSGWSVIVGTPLAQVDAAARQALWSGSLLALGIILLGGLLATFIGAKLVRAVNALVGATGRDGASARPTGIIEIDAVADALRSSAAAREESERHQQMLIGELNHRVKNTLAIVQSLAHQTFRANASPKDAIEAFEGRLKALAAAHNLLTRQKWETAPMAQIIRTAMAPFCSDSRCKLDGPDLRISPQTAVSLALALHELATNAAKYGALKSDDGVIEVSWTAEDGVFNLLWQETGGPAVLPPNKDGFGMRLIKRSLAAELKGTVSVEFEPEGLKCHLAGRLDTKPAAVAA